MPALIKEGRWASYSFILRVWVRVAIYAVCHDQSIVRIEPRHFTEYHGDLWGMESPALLAAGHAFLASIGPGCLLGVACLLAGWFGSYPRIPDRSVMKGVWLVIGGAELVSLLSGLWVYQTGRHFLPDAVFPEFTLSLVITQTMQLMCYAASAVFSCLLLGWMVWKRMRMRSE